MLNVSERDPSLPTSGEGDMPALRIRGLSKSFGRFVALNNIDLDIAKGELVCFLGPSGCGKTTLLRAIAGLDPQNAGTIHQNGRDISRLPVSRRDFGIVFQSYALFPNLSVERNVGYGLHGTGLTPEQRRTRIHELLKMVGLESQMGKYPSQLSGGQQQRVALARALAPSPSLLLLDEPLSALDAQVRMHLRDQLKQLQRTLGVTTIMVTHDQDEALAIADRIIVMHKGSVEQIGTPEEVFSQPATPFVAGFLGDMNFIPAIVETQDQIIVGERAITVARMEGATRGSKVHLCIRPVDILIGASEDGTSGDLEGTVESLSFRGNFYRVAVRCEQLGQSLDVEIVRSTWEKLSITLGSVIPIQLPSDKLVAFLPGR